MIPEHSLNGMRLRHRHKIRFSRVLKNYLFVLILFLPLSAAGFAKPAEEEPGWYPFQIPTLESSLNVVHVGQLVLDPPAGKHGFVRAEKGHFYFEDKTRARFWGTNLVFDACCPPKESAPRVAERLAKLGYNIVRFHLLDHQRALFKEPRGPDGINSEMLDRFEFLINELKKRGIYYAISVHAGRTWRAADDFPQGDLTPPLGKIVSIFYPKAIERQKEYARLILTHKNPYTKLSCVEDPALTMLELLNENTLWGPWSKGGLNQPANVRSKTALPPYYIEWLDQDFNQWLLKKYGSREALKKAWQGQGAGLRDNEAPSSGTVGRVFGKAIKKVSRERLTDTVRYYAHLEKSFYETMRDFLQRELGLKVPITGTQHYSGMPSLWARSVLDYFDTHGYWDHFRHKGGNQNDREHLRGHFLSYVANPLFQEDPHSADNAAPIVRYALVAMADKPFTVSEWNANSASAFAYELPLLVAAYASFHDWDALYSFRFAGGMKDFSATPVDYAFDESNNTLAQILRTVGALAYMRRDVKPAPQKITLHYREEDIFEHVGENIPGTGNFLWWGKDIPLWAPYVVPIERVIGDFGKDRGPLHLIRKQDPQRYVSTTNELVWDARGAEKAFVTVNTPRFQAVVGDIGNKNAVLENLNIDSQQSAAAACISLEEKPLNETGHALLVVAGAQRGRGEAITENGAWLAWEPGGLPVELEVIHAGITLKNLRQPDKIKIFSLDPNGNRQQEIPLTIVKDRVIFQLGTHNSPWYEVVKDE